MPTADKSREARLRRAAKRQRCELHRSPRRDPRAWDYGLYWLELPDGVPLFDGNNEMLRLTLDQVEEWLNREPAAVAS